MLKNNPLVIIGDELDFILKETLRGIKNINYNVQSEIKVVSNTIKRVLRKRCITTSEELEILISYFRWSDIDIPKTMFLQSFEGNYCI
jgi:hypothetical protein